MIIVNSADVKGVITPDPHRRELKVLLSPLLEEEVQGFSVGMTILPPGNSTSNHAHESEVALDLYKFDHGITAAPGDVEGLRRMGRAFVEETMGWEWEAR